MPYGWFFLQWARQSSAIPGHIWKKMFSIQEWYSIFWQFDNQVIFRIGLANFTSISDVVISRTDVVIMKRLNSLIPAKALSQFLCLPVTAEIADYVQP